jgi:hypothetical protein
MSDYDTVLAALNHGGRLAGAELSLPKAEQDEILAWRRKQRDKAVAALDSILRDQPDEHLPACPYCQIQLEQDYAVTMTAAENLEARVAELEAALKPLAYPFPGAFDDIDDENPEMEIDCCVNITFADVRRARTLLKDEETPHD